ncbi:DNA-binding CsgD family transcriptional regulator [Pedobacter sp. UYEF25]
MKVVNTSFYFDFLKQSQNRHLIESLKVPELLTQFGRESYNYSIFGSVFYLTNFVENANFFSNQNANRFLGYCLEDLLKTDGSFLNELRHTEDLQVFNEQIFPDQMAFLERHKDETNVEYSFTTNFRIKNSSNDWSYVVQRTVYIFSRFYRMPIASLNWITDVTNFKNDAKINHLIESFDGINERIVVELKCYFLKKTQEILSKREVDVLKLASIGMASREIANQLNISIHTINNHRRNMLERCNCKNILQLVDIAVKSGVL